MPNSYYFDTSIWLDIYESRGYNGQKAKELMKFIIINDFIVIYSDMIIFEFKKLGYSQDETNRILNIAKPNNIRRVHSTKSQIEEALRIAKKRKVPYGDTLHAIIARDTESQLISRDHDFDKLRDITRSKIPEDLI